MNVNCSRRIVSMTGCLAAAFALATPAMAMHQQTPRVTQVTQQNSGTIGQSAVWGALTWYFQASGDSLGTGNTTPEFFMYDMGLRILGGAFGLTQVTCGGFSPDNPSISSPTFGSVLAFDAVGTLCSDPRHNCLQPFDASSTVRQIFAYDPETSRIRQLTRCPVDCTNPSLSHNAQLIAFESTADLAGTNGGASFPASNVYQGNLRRLGPTCPMLPCSPDPRTGGPGVKNLTPIGGGRNASQNFNGKYVAFESDGDPLNNGANPGISRIYVLNVKKSVLAQAPAASLLPERKPSLDLSGHRVAYEIDVPRPGPSPFVVTEIWVSKFRGNGNAVTIRLTNGATGNSYHPSMGPNGRRVTFTSEADLLKRGVAGPQIYSYRFASSEFDKKRLIQLTGGPSGSDSPVQTAYVFAGFSSSDDLLGNGNTTPQFFVANPFKLAPGSVLSPFPGTPTPHPTATPIATPSVGVPARISLALLTNQAVINNNDNTLTTIIAATVSDRFSHPVPDGTLVYFSVPSPPSGLVIGSSGVTNGGPDCNTFVVQNRPGVAHVCVTYPGALANTSYVIIAESGPKLCIGGANPGTQCTEDRNCPSTFQCSLASTTCNIGNGNTDCPVGETCEVRTASCEHSAIDQGTLVLPLPVNECVVNDQPCSDGNPCTLNDICAGGDLTTPPTCQPGTPKSCPIDGNACTTDVCNFLTGACGIPLSCPSDGNPCTTDVCDSATGTCGILNADPCTDDDPCTVGDQCLAGTCQPGPTTQCPDDGDSCTIDICNPTDGTCGIRFDPCACSAPKPAPTATATPTATPTPTVTATATETATPIETATPTATPTATATATETATPIETATPTATPTP
jgi:hypothetical protein